MRHITLTLSFMAALIVIPHSAQAQAGNTAVYASIYKKAKKFYAEKKYTAARALFIEVKDFAKRGGTYAHIIDYRIGLCYEGEGNNKEAVRHYQIYLQAKTLPAKWPQRADVEAKIASLSKTPAVANNTTVQTRKNKILKDISAKISTAFKLKKEKNYAMAAEYFKEVRRLAISIGVHSPLIDFHIGDCLAQGKNYQAALYWLKRYVNTSTVIKKRWPSKYSVRKYIKAIEVIIAKSKSTVVLNTSDARVIKMNTLMREGYALLKQGQYSAAIRKFHARKRLEIQLKYYNHYIDYYIAYCYDLAGNARLAVTYYKYYLNAPVIKRKWPSANSVQYRIRELSGDDSRRQLFNSGTSAPTSNNYNPYATSNTYNGPANPPNGGTTPPGANYGYQDDGKIFGMNKWLFWGIVAVGAVVIIATLAAGGGGTTEAGYKKSGIRRLGPGAIPGFNNPTGVNVIRF